MLPLILLLAALPAVAQTRLNFEQIAAHTPQKPGTRPSFRQAVQLITRKQYQPGVIVWWQTATEVATGDKRRLPFILKLESVPGHPSTVIGTPEPGY